MKTLPCGRGRYRLDLQKVIDALSTTGDRSNARVQTANRRSRALSRVLDIAVSQAQRYRAREPSRRFGSLPSRISPSAREAFEHCWDVESVPVKAIRRRIFEALPVRHQGRCPYCALPTVPGGLDHFLAKSDIWELALYDRNLVPCCSKCNSEREKSFLDDEQRVIHFYDDDIDAVPDILRAKIDEERGAPVATYSIVDPAPLGAELYARHFKALKLGATYRKWASTAMRDTLTEVLRPTDSAANWTQELMRAANDLSTRWGNNEPKVALLRALALRPDILARLVQP